MRLLMFRPVQIDKLGPMELNGNIRPKFHDGRFTAHGITKSRLNLNKATHVESHINCYKHF